MSGSSPPPTPFDPACLVRPDLAALPPYLPSASAPAGSIKLDTNENLYGPSPRVLAALAAAAHWEYYAGAEELRPEIAAYAGVGLAQVVVTNGADELIDLLLRAVLEPGEAVIDCPPSFEMYALFARVNRGRVIAIERRADFSVDVEGVQRAQQEHGARLVLLTSPANPDGSLLAAESLARLLELPALIVVDEAYAEFAGGSFIPWLAHYPNLALLRTFSKWAALAGLRAGYGLLPPALVEATYRLKAPYNVNAAAILAARASLADRDYLLANVAALAAERDRLARELPHCGLHPFPSSASFLLCRVAGGDAPALRAALAARGLLVRAYPDSPRLRGCLRISVGRPEHNDALLQALEHFNTEGLDR